MQQWSRDECYRVTNVSNDHKRQIMNEWMNQHDGQF